MAFRIRRRVLLAGAAATAAAPVFGLAQADAAGAAPASAAGGGLAEVIDGTRQQVRVRVVATGEEFDLQTRGFAKGWKHHPGDLVVVQPISAAAPRWDQSVVEPFTRVVPVAGGLEVWAANLREGPRLGAQVTR